MIVNLAVKNATISCFFNNLFSNTMCTNTKSDFESE